MTEPRLTHLVAQLLGNREVIPFSPAIARAIGDVEATVFLCQACYWQSLIGPGKWFFKLRDAQRGPDGRLMPPPDGSRQSWEWETALSRTRQESARRRLKALGLLEEALKGVPAQLYYRVNLDRLTEFLLATHQLAGLPPTGWQGTDHLDGGKRAGQSEGKAPAITETTPTTTQTTTTSTCSSMGGCGEDATVQVVTERPPADFMASMARPPEEVVVVVDKWAEPYRETLMRELLRAQLKSDEAQLIADEFAGVLEAASVGEHRGIRSKHGWIKRVIALCKAGEFVPEYGRRVKARRQRFRAEPIQHTLPASTNHEVVDAHLDIMRSALKQPRRHL